jgi:hypothetical protein
MPMSQPVLFADLTGAAAELSRELKRKADGGQDRPKQTKPRQSGRDHPTAEEEPGGTDR